MSNEVVPGLVSIVMPCFRGERWLTEAIESCLSQSYGRLELIVVDDASPDSCAAIADSFSQTDPRVKVLRQPENGGVARAFNAGFAVAQGEFFTRLAQDDVLEADAIERMVKTLQSRRPRAGLVYCDIAFVDETGGWLRDLATPEPERALLFGNDILFCVMWTRQVWDTIGGFDPNTDSAEDFDYWVRVAAEFPLARCDGPPALRWRQHGGMGTVQSAQKQQPIKANILIRAARDGRFQFNRRWLGRHIGGAFGHLEMAYSLAQQQRCGKAALHTLLSLVEWPFCFPASASRLPWWHRPRTLASFSGRALRSFFSFRQNVARDSKRAAVRVPPGTVRFRNAGGEE